MEEKRKHEPFEDEIIDLDADLDVFEENPQEKNERPAEIEEVEKNEERKSQEFTDLEVESIESAEEGGEPAGKDGGAEPLAPKVEEVTGVEDSDDEEFLVDIGEEEPPEKGGDNSIESDGGVPVFEEPKKDKPEDSKGEFLPEGEEKAEPKAEETGSRKEEAGRKEAKKGEEKKKDGKKIDLKNKKVVIGVVSVAGLLVGLGVLGFLLGGGEEAPTVSRPYVPSKKPAFAVHRPQKFQPHRPPAPKSLPAPKPEAGQKATTGKVTSPVKTASREKLSEINRLASSIIRDEKSGENKQIPVSVNRSPQSIAYVGQNGRNAGSTGNRTGVRTGAVATKENRAVSQAAALQEDKEGVLSVVVGKDKNIALLKKELEYKKLLLQEKQT